MLLLIDNYDSFVFNLARYFERLGQETVVLRNDVANVERVRAMQPAAIVLSPGPCTPTEAGCSLEIVRELHDGRFRFSASVLGIRRSPRHLAGESCERASQCTARRRP